MCYFRVTPDLWHRQPQELRERLVAVARSLEPALRIVIAHHVQHADPIILEGDGLLPAFARQQPHGVRSLFLVADDEERVAQAMRQRSRGFEERTRDEQLAQIRLNWLFGQWLREEAQRLTLPVLNARPRETLLDRALDLLL